MKLQSALIQTLLIVAVSGTPYPASPGPHQAGSIVRAKPNLYPSFLPPTLPGSNTLMPARPSSATSSPAIGTSALPASSPRPPAEQRSVQLSLVNNLSSKNVHAYITGLDGSGQVVFVTAAGGFYYPPSAPGSSPQPIRADVAVLVRHKRQLTLPGPISSARIWISEGPLMFSAVNTPSGTGLVQPTVANPNDPNQRVHWGFCEFTSTPNGELYANLSFVDFLGLPLGLSLVDATGGRQTALGPSKDAVAEVCRGLRSPSATRGQGAAWARLCERGPQGEWLRVLSPSTYIARQASGAFEGYWDGYWKALITRFAQQPLVIDTQSAAGVVRCSASIADQVLRCDGDSRAYSRPSAADVFGCASGTFAISAGDNDIHRAVVPRLCAAMNRGTALLPRGNVQPQLPPSRYYVTSTNNRYSALVHATEAGGRGYTFPYDDVATSVRYDAAGVLIGRGSGELTVVIGGHEHQ